MSQAGLESFGAYQKTRESFDFCYLKRISVTVQAEQTGAFCRPFGTWGSHFNAFPGLKAVETLGYYRLSLRDLPLNTQPPSA